MEDYVKKLAELKVQQDALASEREKNQDQAFNVNMVGALGDAFSNRQTAGNFWLGKMNPQKSVSGITNKFADNVLNRTKNREQEIARTRDMYDKFQMMKAQNEMNKGNQIDLLKEKTRSDKDLLGMRSQSAKEIAEMKQAQKGTVGQQTLDREFAKDFNEWTSGKRENAKSEIEKLKNVAKMLENKDLTTGMFTGLMPDRFTSDALLQARADVNSTVMNSLRAILGAQFTEKEGERIIKNTWNEGDSTENNLARVQRLAQDLEAQAKAKDVKADYFSKKGSLQDFGGEKMGSMAVAESMSEKPQQEASAQSGPKVGVVENGYRFKGGDASDPSNWEKVK